MIFARKKDLKNRKFFKKYEFTNLVYKYLKISLLCNFKYKTKNLKNIKKLIILLLKHKPLYSKVKIINRCVLTNRSKSASKDYHIERNTFRDLLQFGLVPGYRKAVW